MKNTGLIKQITILILVVMGFPSVSIGASDSVTFAWEWDASQTSYTVGEEGEIAFHLYMRTGDDEDYDADYPALEEIDNCSLSGDLYTCQATLTHAFEPGVSYFFSAAAYLRSDQTVISSLSNEVEYVVEDENETVGEVEDDQGDENTDEVEDDEENDLDGDDQSKSTETSPTSESSAASGGGGGCFVRDLCFFFPVQ